MKRALIGAGLGLILLVLGFIICGGGHGIFIFWVISCSPLPGPGVLPYGSFSLVSNASMFAAPLLWAGFALLTKARQRWIFRSMMVLHYITIVAYSVITWNDDLVRPFHFGKGVWSFLAPFIASFVIIYLAGQIWLWRTYCRARLAGE